MKKHIDQKLLDAIKAVVEKELEPARIERVDVDHEIDHDGDPILRIQIVFEIEGDRLNPKSVRGLGRHLREPLEKLRVDDFPVFSFATLKEFQSAAA
jgi:hypothetical protein